MSPGPESGATVDRTRTLMEGADRCDFRYRQDKTKA